MHISLEQVGKKYGKHWVFRKIDAQFESGHCYPIIGSNGSGKSTLLQVISGFVSSNEGKIIYKNNDLEIPVEQWYRHISIATPYLDLFEEFNTEETISLHQKLQPLSRSKDEIIASIDLVQHAHKPLKALSSGMRQRVKLALAIFSSSPMLLLDEPTSNLDKTWTNWFKSTLAENREDRLVIICSNSNDDELWACDQPAIDMNN